MLENCTSVSKTFEGIKYMTVLWFLHLYWKSYPVSVHIIEIDKKVTETGT